MSEPAESPRPRRTKWFALGALAVAGAAFAIITAGGIGENLVYYWGPAELHAAGEKAVGATIRLGGKVNAAFGGEPVDSRGRALLRQADDAVVNHLCAGDAEGFFDEIRAAGDRNNICGLPPAYLALRYLGGGVTGERIGYARCPADGAGTSLVSVGGVVWR